MKREFVGRGLLVLALGVGGIGSAWAVDWSACAAGDIVALAAGESATVTDADISSVAALGGIDLGTGATITFDISGELVLQGYLKGAGTVIKNGTGLLRYTLLGNQDYKLSDPGETIVNAGILELPSTADTAYNYAAFEFSRMTVNNPGVLRICERGTSYVLGLWGDGTVTNALKTSPYAQFQVRNDTRGLCSVFSGKMTGPALRACYAAYCDFLNPDNDNAGETSFQAGLNVGITKFGNKGDSGSLGKSPYNLRGGNVRFRYLGTGETSTRDLYFSQQSDRFTFDAGTHGDFHWAGHVESYYSANNQKMRTLCLAGSNAVPCTFSGSIVCKELNDGDVQTNLFLRKEGPGRWNMLDKPADATANSVRSFAGNVEVVEGTLGFASIAEKGTACSLGTGLLWQDSYATA